MSAHKQKKLLLTLAAVMTLIGPQTIAPCQAEETHPQALQDYYKEMWARIQKTWWVPEELMFKQVKLHMIIEKDGTLTTLEMAKSSGDPRADNLAMIGVKRAAPFSPLAEGMPIPFNTIFTIGFAGRDDKAWVLFNGKHYGRGESYTLPTGTKVGHGDLYSSEMDKQFHLKKEANLLKMNKLYDSLAADKKAGPATAQTASLLMEYANCLVAIQEQGEAREKLNTALQILEKNNADETTIYPCLSRLAQLNYTVGDLKTAEPLFQKVLAIKEKNPPAPGAKDPEYKSLLENYAKLLYKLNRIPEADEIYKKIRTLG